MRASISLTIALIIIAMGIQVAAANSGDAVCRKITLETREDNTATLTVELSAPAGLVLYYDNQTPANPQNLESFWFVVDSKTRTNTHVFELEELLPGETYVYRIEQTFPTRRVEPLRKWKIGSTSPETIVLLEK